MVPSYFKCVTRAMRGEAKRLSRSYLRQNGGKCKVVYVLIFRRRFIAEMFSTLSRLFVRLGFRFRCARLAVQSFAIYSVLGSLIATLR